MTAHIVRDDLRGEECRARGGADIGDDAAALHVIAAETAAGAEIALDEGNIVIVPQLAGNVFIKVQRHDAFLGIEDGAAELTGADEHIVGHRVAAEKGAAVVGNVGRLRIGPLVVALGDGDETFDGGKVIIACARGLGEQSPVGLVEEEQLGRLCDGQDLDAAFTGEVALAQIVGDEVAALFLGEVLAEVGDLLHLVERVSCVGIGGEDVGHGSRADLPLCRGEDIGFKIVDTALAGAFDGDAVFLSDGRVELIDERVERLKLLAVVVGPDRDGHRLARRGGVVRFLRAAAG